MNPVAKLGGFGLLLLAVLGAGAATGRAVGPIDTSARDDAHSAHGSHDTAGPLPAGGLLVSQDGITFVTADRVLDQPTFRFRITGSDGTALTHFDLLHDRRLHLIVASRDLQSYAHLHPKMAEDGTWSVEVPPLPGGAYRAYADFRPAGGDQVTLGIDLTVPGPPPPATSLRAVDHDRVDGLDVGLDLREDGSATVTVRRGGEIVMTQPYLGAAGHLVALRDGDLAYLHVHPLDEAPSGPVRFAVAFPSPGRYALFFDFQVDGKVRTARFVVDQPAAGTDATHPQH